MPPLSYLADEEIAAILTAHGGYDLRIAQSEEERQGIWYGRKSAAGAFSLVDPKNHIGMFYTHEILGMIEAYSEIHPTLRDLAYEAMDL